MEQLNLKIKYIDHHRNGVGGAPFDVVLFDFTYEGVTEPMVAIVFREPQHTAVLNIEKLAEGDVEFGSNSYRGDWFDAQLRKAIKNLNEESLVEIE
jgi:hypothetical protein